MQQRVLRMDGDEDPNGTTNPNGPTSRFANTRSLASTVFKTHMADGDEDPVETLISRLVFVEVRPEAKDNIFSELEQRGGGRMYITGGGAIIEGEVCVFPPKMGSMDIVLDSRWRM